MGGKASKDAVRTEEWYDGCAELSVIWTYFLCLDPDILFHLLLPFWFSGTVRRLRLERVTIWCECKTWLDLRAFFCVSNQSSKIWCVQKVSSFGARKVSHSLCITWPLTGQSCSRKARIQQKDLGQGSKGISWRFGLGRTFGRATRCRKSLGLQWKEMGLGLTLRAQERLA